MSGHPGQRHFIMWKKLLVSLMATAAAIGNNQVVLAQPVKNPKPQTLAQQIDDAPPTEAGSGQRVVSFSLKQLGAWSSIKLRGVDGARSLVFAIRADEVVVGARLRLGYDYSPALIPELSHLAVSLNDRVTMLEGLPQGKALGNVREISLNPRLFRESNELRFNFVGHYTRQCEDPYHSSLWLTVSDLSRLELTLAPISAQGDLRHLPAPFIDRQDIDALALPFVFGSPPSPGTIKAAGIVASWFGAQAGARGAQFPTALNELPQGHAVVFLRGGESIGGVRSAPGATISIQPNPANPRAKLLVIAGATDAEIQRAAHAIALSHRTLAGPSVSVTKEVESERRKPYDAPAWVRVDRPMRFGEIAKPEELRVQGFFPEVVRLNYRVPPDLFTWRSEGVPVNLKYRASRLPTQKSSSLSVAINANFLETYALNEPEKLPADQTASVHTKVKPAIREASLFIPPYATTGRDQLQMTYAFDVIQEGECRNLPPDNLQGAIDPESIIDFSGFPHYVAMPNLSYFAKLGYPYTRMADLSETAVVLSERPNAEDLSLYLALMGRMGESTGYPTLRHEVVNSADVEKMADRDLIVIGSAKDQSLLTKWANHLPMAHENGERRVRESVRSWRPSYRWEQRDIDAPPKTGAAMNIADVGQLAVIMAFESPLKSSRSVVFFHADRPNDLRKLTDALTDNDRLPLIQGDFAVVDDKNISHAQVSDTYYVGALPTSSKLRWFFQDQPFLIALLSLIATLLLATLLYRPLRRLVTKRKTGNR